MLQFREYQPAGAPCPYLIRIGGGGCPWRAFDSCRRRQGVHGTSHFVKGHKIPLESQMVRASGPHKEVPTAHQQPLWKQARDATSVFRVLPTSAWGSTR